MKHLNINTNGNKKLRNTEKTRFIIWSLPAVKTCPFATELCKKSCYARKAERIYKNVLTSRENNYIETLQADFVENMVFTISEELKKKTYQNKTVVFRIHESGDFYNLEYAQKWIAITKHFENDSRIKFLAYTKSITYFINCGFGLSFFPSNLVIRSSLWSDTNADKIELTNAFNIPVYTALTVPEMDALRAIGHRFAQCACDDCANCGLCWNNSIKDIICKIH